jgi:hypothetical protein
VVCVSGVSSTVVVLGVLLVGTLAVLAGVLVVLVFGAGVVGVAWGAASVSVVLLHETLRQLSPNATALTVTKLLSVGRKRFSLRAGVALASIGVLQGKGSRVDDERGG